MILSLSSMKNLVSTCADSSGNDNQLLGGKPLAKFGGHQATIFGNCYVGVPLKVSLDRVYFGILVLWSLTRVKFTSDPLEVRILVLEVFHGDSVPKRDFGGSVDDVIDKLVAILFVHVLYGGYNGLIGDGKGYGAVCGELGAFSNKGADFAVFSYSGSYRISGAKIIRKIMSHFT